MTIAKPRRPLSEFQLAALQYAAVGTSAQMTATALGTTTDSVRRAWQVARTKMNTRSIAGAVSVAIREGYPMVPPRFGGTDGRDGWVRQWQHGREFVDHLRGIPWRDATIPPPDHQCIAQTRALVRIAGLPLMPMARCACGAVQVDRVWEGRNSRTTRKRGEEDPQD